MLSMLPVRKKLIFAFLFFPGLLLVVKITQASALTVDPAGKVIIERRGEVLSKSTDDVEDGKEDNSGPSKEKTDDIRTETLLPSGTKIETRQEPDRTRIDIYEGGTKLRLERREDRTVIKMEDEKGEKIELPPGTENEVFKIEERADKGQVRVSTLQDRFVFSREDIAATTNFPLSINLETNKLTVTTPAGEKVVTVLPDQAVKNMLAANVIDQVGGAAFVQDAQKVATQAGTTLEDVIKLSTTREGVLAYEIPGIKQEKLLGFLNVNISKTALVSAETGELLGVRQNLLSQILDLVSF